MSHCPKQRIYENKDTSPKDFKICPIDNEKSFHTIDLYAAELFINVLMWACSYVFFFGKKAEATWT